MTADQMTDPSPLLPSYQVKDASSEPKTPTPYCTRFLKVIFSYLVWPAVAIILLFVYFDAPYPCTELPNYIVIIGIEIALGLVNTLLTMVHNCKANTFFDPSELDMSKIGETGEQYKGHKALAVVSAMIFFVMMAVGIWAFVYALQNQGAKNLVGCSGYWFVLLIYGISSLVILGVLLIGSIYYAIYKRDKPRSESNNFSA